MHSTTMKKLGSNPRGTKKGNFFPARDSNAKKGADQDLQLALALSISLLPMDAGAVQSQVSEDLVGGKAKRKRVHLDKTEVPTLLVTTEKEYSVGVMRRAHNILDVSSNETNPEPPTTDALKNQSLWTLASLSDVTDCEEFLVDKLTQADRPVSPINTPASETKAFSLVYNRELPFLSSNFSGYLFSPFLSDTVLVTKDSYKIPSHLFILAAHSSLIRELISEQYNMRRILMSGHEIQAVIPLLEFMYLGKFEFDSNYLELVRRLACILQMDLFLECLLVHERIEKSIRERGRTIDSQSEISVSSQDLINSQSIISQNSLPNLFLKATKDNCTPN